MNENILQHYIQGCRQPAWSTFPMRLLAHRSSSHSSPHRHLQNSDVFSREQMFKTLSCFNCLLICSGRASGLGSENFSIIVIEHFLCKSMRLFVCEKEKVCRKKKKMYTKVSLPGNMNHTKSVYTHRDINAILKPACWVPRPNIWLHFWCILMTGQWM